MGGRVLIAEHEARHVGATYNRRTSKNREKWTPAKSGSGGYNEGVTVQGQE